jgi:Flp pilus assembly protein TadB
MSSGLILLALVAAIVLISVGIALFWKNRAKHSEEIAQFASVKAADAEASVAQVQKTEENLRQSQDHHVTEKRISDEKIAHGDRDHLDSDW